MTADTIPHGLARNVMASRNMNNGRPEPRPRTPA